MNSIYCFLYYATAIVVVVVVESHASLLLRVRRASSSQCAVRQRQREDRSERPRQVHGEKPREESNYGKRAHVRRHVQDGVASLLIAIVRRFSLVEFGQKHRLFEHRRAPGPLMRTTTAPASQSISTSP